MDRRPTRPRIEASFAGPEAYETANRSFLPMKGRPTRPRTEVLPMEGRPTRPWIDAWPAMRRSASRSARATRRRRRAEAALADPAPRHRPAHDERFGIEALLLGALSRTLAGASGSSSLSENRRRWGRASLRNDSGTNERLTGSRPPPRGPEAAPRAPGGGCPLPDLGRHHSGHRSGGRPSGAGLGHPAPPAGPPRFSPRARRGHPPPGA